MFDRIVAEVLFLDEARRTLAQIVSGIFVLAGLYSSVQTLALQTALLSVSKEGQIMDRFTKAIEQLGATDAPGRPKREVRLGAIFALERIARDSERDHWPVMEVLAAYIRERCRRDPSVSRQVPVGEDVIAAITVIGRRNTSYDTEARPLNFDNVDLSGVMFLYDAHFEHASFDDANLSGAGLSASSNHSSFSRANLSRSHGIGKFQFASFSDADLSHSGLGGSDFFGASFNSTNLTGADLGLADFAGADLSEAKGFAQLQLNQARGDKYAKLPNGIERPIKWSRER